MRNRMLWVALLGLAEVAVCAAILTTTWGGVTWARDKGLQWRVFSSDTVSVESDEELRFPVSAAASLDLTNHNGAIEVTAGQTDEIVVKMHRQAWGATEAEAQARLAALTVNASQSGQAVTVAVPEADKDTLTVFGDYRADSIVFSVLVPAETAVTASTHFGDVALSGTTGRADLRTRAGQASVRHVTGDVSAHSDFGDVVVEDVMGEQVEARSSSGAVRLRRIAATGALEAETNFGEVLIENSQASAVTAHTSSGKVTLSGLVLAGHVSARSDFGAVQLDGVQAGSYELHSSSGAVSADGASGPVQASTDFGDVTVLNAVSATVDLRTSSGSVRFAGSLGSGPHSLESDFGSISLSLPAETRANLDLSTDFGRIESDFPVTVAGGLADDHWQGTLNGGGPALTVSTSNGDITLEQLP